MKKVMLKNIYKFPISLELAPYRYQTFYPNQLYKLEDHLVNSAFWEIHEDEELKVEEPKIEVEEPKIEVEEIKPKVEMLNDISEKVVVEVEEVKPNVIEPKIEVEKVEPKNEIVITETEEPKKVINRKGKK